MDSADRITHLLERLARLLISDGHHQGLKPVQWEVLRYLSRANRFSRTPSALTSYLGSTKGTVSQTLMTLQRRGWLLKQRDPVDRRSVSLDLTEEGRRIMEEDPLGRMAEAVSQSVGANSQQLATDLERILLRRLEASGGKTFGLCRTCHHFERSKGGETHHCRLLDVPLTSAESEKLCIEHQGGVEHQG